MPWRRCSQCEAPVKRDYGMCGPCTTKRRHEVWAAPRVCACGEPIPAGRKSYYCRDCASLQYREWKQRHCPDTRAPLRERRMLLAIQGLKAGLTLKAALAAAGLSPRTWRRHKDRPPWDRLLAAVRPAEKRKAA